MGISSLYIFRLPPFSNFQSTIVTLESTEEPLNSINTQKKPRVLRPLKYQERLKKAATLYKNHFYTLAIKEYTLASQNQPNELEPLQKIAQIHLETRSFDQAIATSRLILDKNPQHLETLLILIKALIGAEKFQEAADIAKTKNSEDQRLYFYQGLLASFFQEKDLAKNSFLKAKEINTKAEVTAAANNFLNTYQVFDNVQEAKTEYLLTLLAKNYNENKEFQLASALLNKVITTLPDYRDAWILLGFANLNLEKYSDAVTNFEKALLLDPERPDIRYFLGLAYFGLNKNQSAITNLEIALENGYQPQVQIYQKLAEMHLIEKEYPEAYENYRLALEITDQDVNYYIRPVWTALTHLKSSQKCLTLANQAISRHPQEALSYNLLGWCQLANNDFTSAKSNLEKALQIDPNLAAAYLNLGQLYEKLQDSNQAKNNYKKAYEIDPFSSVGNLAAKLFNELISAPANL